MIVIDVREEHELKEKQLKSDSIQIINIPMRSIVFNIDYINKLAESDKVYLVCRSANRSKLLKERHFKDNENVFYGKLEDIKDASIEPGTCTIKCGMQQYMQVMFLFILAAGVLINFFTNKYIFLLFNIMVIFMIVYQLLSKSCFLGKMLMKF